MEISSRQVKNKKVNRRYFWSNVFNLAVLPSHTMGRAFIIVDSPYKGKKQELLPAVKASQFEKPVNLIEFQQPFSEVETIEWTD